MNNYKSLKITGFYQIILSIFLIFIYNILAVSVFPPDLSSGAPVPSISFLLSSQILGFFFTSVTLIFAFRVFEINEYLKFDISFLGLMLALSTLLLAIILISSAEYLQKSIVPVYLISSYLSMSGELHSGYESLARMLVEVQPAMLYLAGALLPAVCEEFFFRGFLLQLSLKYYSKLTSLFIVSAIFSLLHFQIIAVLPLFIFGFLLGLLTLKTGRLSYAVLVHFLNNTFTLYIVSN
ncbi:MAG: CPBP family intramembrane metalloprotease [Ignavibacteriae bacterium]|nr:CPBP family intramembrane metalloprotease [Ignavibacteriota bacterium]